MDLELHDLVFLGALSSFSQNSSKMRCANCCVSLCFFVWIILVENV